MKKVLVTGANGRIGRAVVPLLLARGYRVSASVRRDWNSPWGSDVEIVRIGFPATRFPAEVVEDVDAVVHLAGIMPPASDEEVFGTNVEGTRQLLQAISNLPRKPRLLFASSDATYCTGWSLGAYTAPITEDAEQHPTVFYGLSKVLGERLCLYYQEMHQVPVVRLRFVWTLEAPEILDLFIKAPYKDFVLDADRGKWDGTGVIAAPLEEDGQPFTEHVCDVRDAAEAVALALESDAAPGQAFNVAGPAAFRYTEVGPALASKNGFEVVQARCRGIHSYELSLQKSRALLGYRPRYAVMDSLEEALAAIPKSN
ncbi:MAG: NAD(P)-dependent oxidoreductase [Bryobacteraceae bacterium]